MAVPKNIERIKIQFYESEHCKKCRLLRRSKKGIHACREKIQKL